MTTLNFTDPNAKLGYKSPFSFARTLSSILTWHALRTHALEQIGWNQTRRIRSAVLHGIPIPWFTYASVQFIDQIIPTSAHVLEVGGGNSSLFWINRGNQLVTIETNQIWTNRITSSNRFDRNHHEVITIPMENQEAISNALGDRLFDVVISDGLGDRRELGTYLSTRVKENGILIWDNSDRGPDNDAIEGLRQDGWKSLDFFGLGPINAYCTKITILHRGLVL